MFKFPACRAIAFAFGSGFLALPHGTVFAGPFDKSITAIASANGISETEQDLIVAVTVPKGMRIYGLEQNRPLLKTQVEVESTSEFKSVTDFVSVTEPIPSFAPDLRIEDLQHRELARFRCRIVHHKDRSPVRITGFAFAQGCEEEKCFPPKSNSFVVDSNETEMESKAKGGLEHSQVIVN
jgi:hypothetical protein